MLINGGICVKRIISVAAALFLTLTFAVSAFAQGKRITFDELGISFEIPETMYYCVDGSTVGLDENDGHFIDLNDKMKSSGITFLGTTLEHYYSLSIEETDALDFKNMNESYLNSLAVDLAVECIKNGEMAYNYGSFFSDDSDGYIFISTLKDDVYGARYFTVKNGKMFTFLVIDKSPLSDSTVDVLKSIVKTVTFDISPYLSGGIEAYTYGSDENMNDSDYSYPEPSAAPEEETSPVIEDVASAVLVILILVSVVVLIIIVLLVKRNKKKKAAAQIPANPAPQQDGLAILFNEIDKFQGNTAGAQPRPPVNSVPQPPVYPAPQAPVNPVPQAPVNPIPQAPVNYAPQVVETEAAEAVTVQPEPAAEPTAPAGTPAAEPVVPAAAPVAPAPEVPVQKVNFCPSCGTKLNDGQVFCHNCGAKI